VTLLHCGPGLANGLANLHNGRTPIVDLIGDQASYHKPLDPPLAAETEALVRAVSAGPALAQARPTSASWQSI
jgi:acetolactate synthase-1/2/3 large subunit